MQRLNSFLCLDLMMHARHSQTLRAPNKVLVLHVAPLLTSAD